MLGYWADCKTCKVGKMSAMTDNHHILEVFPLQELNICIGRDFNTNKFDVLEDYYFRVYRGNTLQDCYDYIYNAYGFSC